MIFKFEIDLNFCLFEFLKFRIIFELIGQVYVVEKKIFYCNKRYMLFSIVFDINVVM